MRCKSSNLGGGQVAASKNTQLPPALLPCQTWNSCGGANLPPCSRFVMNRARCKTVLRVRRTKPACRPSSSTTDATFSRLGPPRASLCPVQRRFSDRGWGGPPGTGKGQASDTLAISSGPSSHSRSFAKAPRSGTARCLAEVQCAASQSLVTRRLPLTQCTE